MVPECGSEGSPPSWARMSQRGASKRSQLRCFSAAQRSEHLPKGGRSENWMAASCTCACVLHWGRPACSQWKCNVLHLIPSVQHLGAPAGPAGFAAQHRAGLGQVNISQSESIPLSLGPGLFLQQDAHPSHLPGSAGVQISWWELWEGFKSLLSHTCRKDQRICLFCASGAGLIHCFWGCSHPSFSALAGMQLVVCFLHLPTVSFLCSASGPGIIHCFSSTS